LQLSKEFGDKAKEIGLLRSDGLTKTGRGYKLHVASLKQANSLIDKQIESLAPMAGRGQTYIDQAIEKQKKLQEQGKLGATDPDEKALRAQAKAAEEARKLADDKAKYEADLLKMNSLQALELDDIRFEHWKSLQQEKCNILMAGENSWLSQAIKFQKDLQDIEIGRIEAVRKARDASAKAEIEAGAKSYIAGGVTGQMGTPGPGSKTGLLQGSTGISSGPHFDVRRLDGGRIYRRQRLVPCSRRMCKGVFR
jgi:hypothetical protein